MLDSNLRPHEWSFGNYSVLINCVYHTITRHALLSISSSSFLNFAWLKVSSVESCRVLSSFVRKFATLSLHSCAKIFTPEKKWNVQFYENVTAEAKPRNRILDFLASRRRLWGAHQLHGKGQLMLLFLNMATKTVDMLCLVAGKYPFWVAAQVTEEKATKTDMTARNLIETLNQQRKKKLKYR